MLSVVQFVLDLVFKVLGLRTSRQKQVVEDKIEFIDNCLSHMKAIMYEDSPDIELSRKYLQRAHHELPSLLSSVASAKECDILKNSIMSARVYYHALRDEEKIDEILKMNYQDRLYLYNKHIYSGKDFRENSYEVFLKNLVYSENQFTSMDAIDAKDNILCVCEEDVARIISLRDELKFRKPIRYA